MHSRASGEASEAHLYRRGFCRGRFRLLAVPQRTSPTSIEKEHPKNRIPVDQFRANGKRRRASHPLPDVTFSRLKLPPWASAI